MSRTVKLEGLSVAVDSKDLRFHFAGLEIPQGGITIIGGKRGVAYLCFTTFEDARRAIQLSGCSIKDSIVHVYPSCTADMEQSLMKHEAPYYSRNGVHEDRDLDRRGSLSPRAHVYLRITVTTGVTTTTSVRRYFSGLHVADVLSIKDDRALRNGALVKFYSSHDANEGMRRYRNSTDVNVVWSNEREWVEYGGKVYYDEDNHSFTSRHERISHHSRSPERHYYSTFRSSRSPRWRSRSPQRYSRSQHEHTRSPQWPSRSPLSGSRSPRLHSRSPHMKSRFPRRLSNENDPIFDGDFPVHVTNLHFKTRKKDLSKWFFDLVNNDQIKFLHGEKGQRTRECFVMFKNEEDQRRALRLDQATFYGRLLFINPISKSSMRNLLTGRNALFSDHQLKGKCLYLRNFPADVTKSDIQKFFTGFTLNEEDISLLCDRQGVGLGEVMVSFSSIEELAKAEKLHRKKFKDKEIPMRRIPEHKLQSFLSANSISLMPEDPNDCVTQEDDLLDEESDQENNSSDEGDQDDDLPDEDSSFHQTDNTHECVTQADDVIDEPAVHVDDAPSTECISDENSIHVDNDTAILEGATSNEDELGQ